jgi:hypothetical protein
MPNYYMHLFNSVGPVRDEEGRDLPDLAAAREEAIRNARSIMAEEIRAGGLDLSARIEIASPTPDDLCDTLVFSDAVTICHAGDKK